MPQIYIIELPNILNAIPVNFQDKLNVSLIISLLKKNNEDLV